VLSSKEYVLKRPFEKKLQFKTTLHYK